MRRASAGFLGVNLLLLLAATSLAERPERSTDIPVANWTAPAHWTPEAKPTASGEKSATFQRTSAFVPLSPCRLADTRGYGFVGAFGPPSMAPAVARNFPVAGQCGVPPDAAAVSFNFTVVRTLGLGYMVAYPQGGQRPGTSILNYVAGQIVANNSVVGLFEGGITAEVAGQGTDLIIDINGYYGGSLVTTLNGLSGDLWVTAGDNMTVTKSGDSLILDASPVPGPAGPQGPQGPQGLPGVQGAPGAQGATGPAGPQGPQGSQGLPGAQGLPGTPGATGPQGLQGSQGLPGPAGPAGPAGEQGAQGPVGPPATFKGAWTASAAYAFGNVVAFGGSTYFSLVDDNADNQPDESFDVWALLAAAGPQGPAGSDGAAGPQGAPGLPGPAGPQGAAGAQGPAGPVATFRGTWSPSTMYSAGQAVAFNGSSYVSLYDENMNHQPDAVPPGPWALLAQAGVPGESGEDGAAGPQGPAGPQGVPGPQGPAGVGISYQTWHSPVTSAGTVFLSPIKDWDGTTEAGKTIAAVPRPCTMTTISAFVTTPVNEEMTEKFVVRIGTWFLATTQDVGNSDLADSSLSCTITAGNQFCTGSSSIAVEAGQIFDYALEIGGPGNTPSPHDALVSVTCQ